mgnify:FL=1
MKPLGKKLLIAFFSLLLLIYIGYQAYLVAYEPYETVVVKEETYTKSLELEGFFVRDEAVLKTGQSGIIGYQYKSGEKVPINAEIARIYEKEADLYALEKIDALTQQRDILNQLQNSTGGEGLKIDLVSQQLADAKYSLMRAVDTGDLSNIDSLSNEILLCLNQYALCIGEDLNITNVIGDIDSEIASLQSQIPNAVGSVKTERSGYFCSTTDGLEEKFSFSSLENLTVADAEEMLAASVSSQTAENVIGKMTYSNGWKFVAVVPASEAAIFKEGATETFSFAAAAGKETSVTVERIITEENAEKAVVIFSGMDMDNDFLTMRFENPRVQTVSYSGIVIPKEAVRIRTATDEEGNTVQEKVVYAMFGNSARARSLDIIYEDDDVIISNATGQSGYISAYDQVIIKGKELNDAEN